MKKLLAVISFVVGLAFPCFAVDSSVVLNTTNGQVFGISYESGVATVTVAGAISATTVTASGTLGVTGIPTFGATQIVFTAAGIAAVASPTNLVAADGVGIPVRYNGTNYFIRLTRN